MRKRALVLGGGGTLGVAWEMGIAVGLKASGLNLSEAELVIGTSAGSVAGALLAFGVDPEAFMMMQAANITAGQAQDLACLDPETLEAVRTKWTNAVEMTPALRKEIGNMALGARTMGERDWVDSVSALLGGLEEWPERRLLVTAVDAASGDGMVWDRHSGVPLYQAVASSCAIPGFLPAVTIKGRRFTDGGVRSGTNADLAAGCDSVLIVAPMGDPDRALGNRQWQCEARALRAAGSAVETIIPDRETLDAFGPDLMVPSRVMAAAEHGIRQGRAAADQIRALWS